MKTLTNSLLWALPLLFITSSSIVAQGVTDYAQNEFVVIYDDTALDSDRIDLRNFYGITSYIPILNGQAEIWKNIMFPLTTGSLDILYDIESLELDINNSSLGDTDPRARVSDGDFQYTVDLYQPNGNGGSWGSGLNAPIPNCTNSNFRIMGSLADPTKPQHFIIIDQFLDNHNLTGRINHVATVTTHPGGNHANQVAWVIDDILTQLGASRITYSNIAAFNAFGSASYTDLLIAFDMITQNNIRNAVLNFSANLNFAERDIVDGNFLSKMVETILTSQNILMISSAGNDANTEANVFPGCLGLPNEISVVGSEACFSSIWANSNTNANHYDIVAEADDVLTYDGSSWNMVAGTSFAAPMVAAVAAQVYSDLYFFSPEQIRHQILNTADKESDFLYAVDQGLVLNATAATGMDPQQLQQSGHLNDLGFSMQEQELTLESINVYPNPVTDILHIELPEHRDIGDVQLVIRSISGPVISKKSWVVGTPIYTNELSSGSYILEITAGTQRWITKVFKH